jgi:diguanylate cyclase (GGDEF)-like protein
MSLTHRDSRHLAPGTTRPAPEDETPVSWRRLFQAPDPMQIDASAEGEMLVARMRTALILCLLPVPIINLVYDPNVTAGLVGLVTCLVGLMPALVAQRVLRRSVYRPWLGLATSLFDVSVVSLGHAAFLVLGQPMTTVNNRLMFDVYFLAIGATALRYDARITLAAGSLAMWEYLGLVLYATSRYDLSNPDLDPHHYGAFDWATQASRIVLLGAATLLAAVLVNRGQRLRGQSRIDRLTQLPNRTFFEERVEAELSRARRYHEPVVLAMLDIDNFKRHNDRWGHAAGDVALREVARTILAGIRQSDMVVRYGGEEFVALFIGLHSSAAFERAEAIREAVAALPLPIPRRQATASVTISIGLAAYGYDGTQVEELLDRADARLFQAKEAGRNRVIGPPPEAQEQEPARPPDAPPDTMRSPDRVV